MSKSLSVKISRVSLILSIMVVLLHAMEPNLIFESNPYVFVFEYSIQYVCFIAVPLFFIMSGYLFFYNLKTIDELKNKIKKRVRSLLIPYLFWNTVSMLFFFALLIVFGKPISFDYAIDFENIILGVFFEKFSYLWFIYYLIIFVFIFSAPIKILIEKKNFYIVLILVFMMILCCEYFKIEMFFRLDSMFYWVLGGYLSKHHRKYIENTDINPSKILLLFLILLITTAITYQLDLMKSILLILIKIVFFWEVFNMLVHIENKFINLKFSFQIYVMHQLILESIQFLTRPFVYGNDFLMILDFIASSAITIAVIVVVSKTIKIYTPNIYSIIFGGR